MWARVGSHTSLGKGEVESSILSGSTIFLNKSSQLSYSLRAA